MGGVGASDKVNRRSPPIPWSDEVQGASCFLNSFSEGSLGAAAFSLSPDFVKGLNPRNYRGVIEPCITLSYRIKDGKPDTVI